MALINNGDMHESDDERDLTSLSWLMELRNQNFSWTNEMQQATLNGDGINNRHNIKCSHEVGGRQKEAYDKTSMFKNKDNCNDKCIGVTKNGHTVKASSNKTLFNEYDKQQKEYTSNSDSEINITKRNWIGKSIENSSKNSFKGVHCQQQQLKLRMKRANPMERYEMFLEKVKRYF